MSFNEAIPNFAVVVCTKLVLSCYSSSAVISTNVFLTIKGPGISAFSDEAAYVLPNWLRKYQRFTDGKRTSRRSLLSPHAVGD